MGKRPIKTNSKTVKNEGTYSTEDLKNALAAIKCGSSIRQAAKDFNIPLSTVYSRHAGIYPLKMKKGPKTVLTEQLEKNLVKWMLHLNTCGYPPTKKQLFDSVTIICKKLKKKTPFINNRPSKSWYHGFLNRHKELLSLQTNKNRMRKRPAITEQVLRNWFNQTATHLESRNLLNISASRIFSLDERAFFLDPKKNQVMVSRGQNSRLGLCDDGKEWLTTLITCNAKGQMPPAILFFKGAKLPANVFKFLPNTFVARKSNTGWMTAECFYEYIVNIFYPWCVKNGIVFPIILYVNGHSSYLTFPLNEFCAEKGIELICLYPNSAHLMQPLDVALFTPLKEAYVAAVMRWRQEHNGEYLNKENFGIVLTEALRSLDLEKILSQGFETCGLHPFFADRIDHNKNLNDTFKNNNEELTENDSNSIGSHINFIEQNIENNTLTLFKRAAATGVYNGPEKNKGLFEFWLKISKNYLSTTNFNGAVTCIIPIQEDLTRETVVSSDSQIDSGNKPSTLIYPLHISEEILPKNSFEQGSEENSMDTSGEFTQENSTSVEVSTVNSSCPSSNANIECQIKEEENNLLEECFSVYGSDPLKTDCENKEWVSISHFINRL